MSATPAVPTPVAVRTPAAVPTPAGRGRRGLVDVAALTAALALATAPLVPLHTAGAAVPALAGGLAAGTAVAAVAARLRWTALPTLAVLVVAYVVVGGALAARETTLAGVLPTGPTVRTLLGGAVTVWKESLTLQAPLGASGGLLVAPFALTFAAAAAAVGIALRARTPGRAVLGATVPVVAGAVALVLGTRETLLPLVTGVVGAGVLVTWASWRLDALQARRVVALAVGAAVVCAGGAVTGPLLAGTHPRHVLREEITPPFDPRDHPSPLAGYRRFVKDWKDTELLTVTGLPAGTPVRLATMDAYDGVVWNVSGQGAAEGSGAFRRPGDPDAARGSAVAVGVQVHALPGVWLPTVGEPAGLAVAGPGADVAGQVRLNDATGAAVLTGGLHEGLRYTVRTDVPAVPEDAAIGDAPAAGVTLPTPTAVPDVVRQGARELAGAAGTPLEVARTLEAALAERGWFSHGITGTGDHPSLSGHGADRMTSLLGGDLMVGDSEQYASAMALMARELGLPARVVLGFRPAADAGDPVTFTGDDARAWVEIAFAGHGWVPFDPTPDESRTPDEQTRAEQADPEPQVVQPPPPPEEPVTAPEEDADPARTQDPAVDPGAASAWLRVATLTGLAGIPLLLVLGPAAVLEALRRRRRRRRRRAADAVDRVVGGWQEVLDTAADLAVPVTAGGTRRETAAHLAERIGPASAAPLTRLATRADAAVFAPGLPAPAEVERYWDTVGEVVTTMRAAAGRGRRLRARWSTASLRRRATGARAPARTPSARSIGTGAGDVRRGPGRAGPVPPRRTATVHAGRDGRPAASAARARGRTSRDGES